MSFSIKKLFGFDKVIDVVDKVVTDKDAKNQIMGEIEKLTLESEVKIQELVNQRMGTKLEKCVSIVFPMVGFVFGLYLLSNLVMYWICFFMNKTPQYLPIGDELFKVIIIYITGFFGKRSVDSFKGK